MDWFTTTTAPPPPPLSWESIREMREVMVGSHKRNDFIKAIACTPSFHERMKARIGEDCEEIDDITSICFRGVPMFTTLPEGAEPPYRIVRESEWERFSRPV